MYFWFCPYTGSKEKQQKTTWVARNRQKKNCNMQSWERAKPLSPFEMSPDGTRRGICMENSGWRAPLGYCNEAKYLPSDFFIDLVLCVVGRFACQVPDLFRNSDGNTGAFFRAENYRKEFYVPKTGGLNVQVFALRVTFPEGTW